MSDKLNIESDQKKKKMIPPKLSMHALENEVSKLTHTSSTLGEGSLFLLTYSPGYLLVLM